MAFLLDFRLFGFDLWFFGLYASFEREDFALFCSLQCLSFGWDR